ncbi:unnamed protein product (macronuclear) [Paramecium tetraurelia]|uniref:Uncharacterized protein n=1 Tax=Paramecium tetraurelia TaxID=5888 RepID=A0D8U6_PARTE|nr:uncharacterized protein GSPATT00014409001 [Paramecium tetraurelia]CAK79463.1 unnamed protein product [Paramecium tetraurelia]|eukprot:XP_001446860.1 hypothetical protein (macronuclear) [Paramecium tetraurelia strain d4-2]
MEFLQKIMMIPQNIINTLKTMKSQTNKVDNIFIEPLAFCQESIVETVHLKEFDQINKRRKLTMNQETQTEPQQKFEQIISINQIPESVSQQKSRLRLVPSKSNKKYTKLLTKQIVKDESLSRESDQTEPSQYSYCHNNFLAAMDRNEEEYKPQQKKIYQINGKNQNQYRNQIRKNYLSQFKEKFTDEKLILKSTRTQSSDEKQDSIDQKELENNQQQQALV